MLSLATSTAPASCRRFTTTASSAGTRLRKGSAPYVVGIPAVSSRSLPPHGMPCSGPPYLPAVISSSACFACSQGQVASECDHAMQLGIELLQSLQVDVRQALGCEFARLDPARELCHWGEGNVFVARGQRTRIGRAADEAVVFRTGLLPRAESDPSAWREPSSWARQACAARCDARRGTPSFCANCRRRQCARRGSFQTAPASRPRRRLSRRLRVRRLGLRRTPGARRAEGLPDFGLPDFVAPHLALGCAARPPLPRLPSMSGVRNCLRDFAMNPPRGILAAIARRVAIRRGGAGKELQQPLTTKDTKVHEGSHELRLVFPNHEIAAYFALSVATPYP